MTPREELRDNLAGVLRTIAEDGLPGPRDLDIALDAIESTIETFLEASQAPIGDEDAELGRHIRELFDIEGHREALLYKDDEYSLGIELLDNEVNGIEFPFNRWNARKMVFAARTMSESKLVAALKKSKE